jgi:hypothetical protein
VEPRKASTGSRTAAAIASLLGAGIIALTIIQLLSALARDGEGDRLSSADLLLRAGGFLVIGLILVSVGLWWRQRHPGERLLAVPHTLDELSTEWGFAPAFLAACSALDDFPSPLPDGQYDEYDVTHFVEEHGVEGARSTREARWVRSTGVMAIVAPAALALSLLNLGLGLDLAPSVANDVAIVSLAFVLLAGWGYATAVGALRRVRFRIGAARLEAQLDQPAWLDRRSAEVAETRGRWWYRNRAARIITGALFAMLIGSTFVPDSWTTMLLVPLVILVVVMAVLVLWVQTSKSDFEAAVRDAEPETPR